MTAVGTAIYAACTDFLLACSHATGMSYRDANALLFFILWPLLTMALIVVVVVQGLLLRRARKKAKGPHEAGPSPKRSDGL